MRKIEEIDILTEERTFQEIEMTKADFFEEFDEVTLLKLDLFRLYVRQWFSVFLSNQYSDQVFVFDFFSGPGKDKSEQKGTPLIIVEELCKYIESRKEQSNPHLSVNLFFNDINEQYANTLKEELQNIEIPGKLSVTGYVTNNHFEEAVSQTESILAHNNIPCLALLDQFGIKHIARPMFEKFVHFQKTDLIFFITSSIYYRFKELEEIVQYMPEIKYWGDFEYRFVHNKVTEVYKSWIPQGETYYLVPFSLKKQANVYGLIFGSHSLYGVEKFLTCTWKEDMLAGTSNMNLYDDIICENSQSLLFKELNVPNRIYSFKSELYKYLQEPKTNVELYEFVLIKGFLPKQANDILIKWQKEGKLKVESIDGSKPRQRAFYINWKNYNSRNPKIKIVIKK